MIEERLGFAEALRTSGGYGGPFRGPPILTSDGGPDAAEVLVDVAREDAGHLAGAHRRRAGEHRAAALEGRVVDGAQQGGRRRRVLLVQRDGLRLRAAGEVLGVLG